MPGQEDDADHEGEDVEREGDEVDGAPPVVLEHPPADEGADCSDAAADAGPQGDCLHLGAATEKRADERQGGREEERGGQPAQEPAQREELGARRPSSHHRGRDGEDATEDEHELAAVAVADRTQIQDRRCEAEREGIGDVRELVLAGPEVAADGWQGDAGDSEIDIRDDGAGDEREQNERAA